MKLCLNLRSVVLCVFFPFLGARVQTSKALEQCVCCLQTKCCSSKARRVAACSARATQLKIGRGADQHSRATHIYTHTYTHTYIHTHIHTHIYTHTYTATATAIKPSSAFSACKTALIILLILVVQRVIRSRSGLHLKRHSDQTILTRSLYPVH